MSPHISRDITRAAGIILYLYYIMFFNYFSSIQSSFTVKQRIFWEIVQIISPETSQSFAFVHEKTVLSINCLFQDPLWLISVEEENVGENLTPIVIMWMQRLETITDWHLHLVFTGWFHFFFFFFVYRHSSTSWLACQPSPWRPHKCQVISTSILQCLLWCKRTFYFGKPVSFIRLLK